MTENRANLLTQRAGHQGVGHQGVAQQESGQQAVPARQNLFLARDGGFTTVGVAVALLLVMALLFSAAQVRWVQSHSADIQYVADAGALAGGNVVGEYMVVARVADAVVLSLSLLGMVVYGVAIVVSCIPYMQSVGAELMQFGSKVFQARDKCAKSAATALNNLQAALPFLIAVNAAATIEANSGISASAASYHGLAIPLPLQGEDLSFPDDDAAEQSADAIEGNNEITAELANAAEEARKAMESSKGKAYVADCVNSPRCMYERAGALAGMSGSSNPYFSSVDTWRFDDAFARAKAYYARRLAIEKPKSQALEQQIQSFCRERLYRFAVDELNRGWCTTSPDGVLDAYFPLLPRNTAEMRQTSLYTERVYPVSADGVMHGSTACPAYQSAGAAGTGSVAELESGSYRSCETCGFAASTIGKVASATTNTDTGFEFYYRIVAEAARQYQDASEDYRSATHEAKTWTNYSLSEFEQALNALKTPRLNPRPPGHNGVIALVIDGESHAIPAGLTNSAVDSSAQLQPRMALSAVALAEEKAGHGANILASFLDRVKAEQGQSSQAVGGLGAFDGILEVWGSALLVYSQGGDAISDGLVAFLDAIPLVKSTPLSRWARTALAETVEAVGLQGADLDTPKPLVVNSVHVLRASDAAPARTLLAAKDAYTSSRGSGSDTLSTTLVEGLTGALADQAPGLLQGEFVLYEISFGDDPNLPRIPITLRLPDGLVAQGQALIDGVESEIVSDLGGGRDGTLWE
ncbi:MAG: hypothetical protein LBJ48_04810 [Coriobacteriales bacterium]|jgi:hypothetical protein|nr:hypothetical protein [Coriobacteriales bacterium]